MWCAFQVWTLLFLTKEHSLPLLLEGIWQENEGAVLIGPGLFNSIVKPKLQVRCSWITCRCIAVFRPARSFIFLNKHSCYFTARWSLWSEFFSCTWRRSDFFPYSSTQWDHPQWVEMNGAFVRLYSGTTHTAHTLQWWHSRWPVMCESCEVKSLLRGGLLYKRDSISSVFRPVSCLF